ncbi:MAG TPA: Holliday junction resolvase RuvX [Saprospiraceae bacterium]|nr:Holliday junction resolvase RuvX [Saprospiraceae bacterium]
MARILGIDFGTKRTGIAATDPLKIIVSPVTTLKTSHVIDFLRNYMKDEEVELIVCGRPGHEYKETLSALEKFIEQLKSSFPDISILFQDEHLSSKRASELIRRAGVPKMKRRDKSLIDNVSAVLILQEYLGHLNDVHLP